MRVPNKRRRRRQPFPLKAVLRAANVSLSELSRRTKIGRPHLSAFAAGRIDPTWQSVCRIADGLSLNLGHFQPRPCRNKVQHGQ